jgi:hypothetical protein
MRSTGFAVENLPDECTFLGVSTTLPAKSKSRRAPKGVAGSRKVFWARPANLELDRSGDWLLKNLSTTRAKAASRASPA